MLEITLLDIGAVILLFGVGIAGLTFSRGRLAKTAGFGLNRSYHYKD